MTQPIRALAAGLVMSLLAAAPALAHPGHSLLSLPAMLLHPFSGWDHFLAAVAVFVWAATALLVLFGLVPGPVAMKLPRPLLLPLAGGGIAIGGLAMALSAA